MMNKVIKYICFIIVFALATGMSAQVKNLIYVDCSSSTADLTLDDWQYSISNHLTTFSEDETVIFVSNNRSPLISTPEDYRDVINDLGLIRPDPPLADFDFRQIISILDDFDLKDEFNFIIYTTSESFQPNVNLNRKLYDRIPFIISQQLESITMEYYIPKVDKPNITEPSKIITSSQFNPTLTYF